MKRIVVEQLIAIGVALLVFPWHYIWGPSDHDFRGHMDYLVPIAIGVWVVCQIVFLVRRFARRAPATYTKTGTFTMWAGIVSAASLFTGFLLGWLAVFLAPVGIVTGIYVFVRELRARTGNDLRNLAGLALCVGAIGFLAA
jgi:hypothetical protein